MGPNEKLFCQESLGDARGAGVIALIETTSGTLCPCKRGLACPLAPVPTSTAEAV
jgi:hypothetical protein